MMNSLFGGFNSFMRMAKNPPLSTAAATTPTPAPTPNILFQALGAALRGEDPHIFMQNLANQHPQLKQYDLTDL